MPTMGLKTFSLSAEVKSSFFAGESDILSVLSADAAWRRVSIGRVHGKVLEQEAVAYLLRRR